MPRLYSSFLLFSVLFFYCLPSVAAPAAPQVVATIKPIHALLASVMQGVAEPVLLIKGNHSPHTFTLKPSQMQQLENADMIFWVGEVLETSLQKTLHNFAESHAVVELMETPGLMQLGARTDKQFSQPSGHSNEQHHHGSIDPHIWLSPYNAEKLVQYMGEKLSQLDPSNAQHYQSNVTDTITRIHALDEQIKQQLAPVQELSFVVFHDAYQHFEQHYHLNVIAAVALSPERLPGARHISEIRQRIKALNARCIFNEIQFKSSLVNSLNSDSHIKTATLDPIGATLTAGPDAWFELMQNISSAISSCLSSATE